MNSLKRLLTISGAVITIFGTTTLSTVTQPPVNAAAKVSQADSPQIRHHFGKAYYINDPQKVKNLTQPSGLRIRGNIKPGVPVEIQDLHHLKILSFNTPHAQEPNLIILASKIEAGQIYQVKIGHDFQEIRAEKFKYPDRNNFLMEDQGNKRK